MTTAPKTTKNNQSPTKSNASRQSKALRSKRNYIPRQIKFALGYYLPNSATFSNSYQSAIAAGYTPYTAKNLTQEDHFWLKTILDDIVGSDGSPKKEELVRLSTQVIKNTLTSDDDPKLAQDSAKFVLSTDARFSKKTDLTASSEGTPAIRLVFGNFGNKKKKGGDDKKQ